jgi:hypothetical protein
MLHYGTQLLRFLKNLKLNFAISLKKSTSFNFIFIDQFTKKIILKKYLSVLIFLPTFHVQTSCTYLLLLLYSNIPKLEVNSLQVNNLTFEKKT